jgi:hypothetical protein
MLPPRCAHVHRAAIGRARAPRPSACLDSAPRKVGPVVRYASRPAPGGSRRARGACARRWTVRHGWRPRSSFFLILWGCPDRRRGRPLPHSRRHWAAAWRAKALQRGRGAAGRKDHPGTLARGLHHEAATMRRGGRPQVAGPRRGLTLRVALSFYFYGPATPASLLPHNRCCRRLPQPSGVLPLLRQLPCTVPVHRRPFAAATAPAGARLSAGPGHPGTAARGQPFPQPCSFNAASRGSPGRSSGTRPPRPRAQVRSGGTDALRARG